MKPKNPRKSPNKPTKESDSWLFDPVSYTSLEESDRQEALRYFSDRIWAYYDLHGRQFPWRETRDPYRILLSELMLQQTQTERVLPKYQLFLEKWPDFHAMADSGLSEVLAAWRGLGYNRRALAIRNIALKSEDYGWTLPADYEQLLQFPMIGPATAAAVMAFAYGKESIYLETNIRRVLIHQFFPSIDKVADRDLQKILRELLTFQSDVKQWYYALMDYGVYLKGHLVNPNRRSAHYQKQPTFANSNRQIRGLLLVVFTEQGSLSLPDVLQRLPFPKERVLSCLHALVEEGFIEEHAKLSEESPPYFGIPSNH